MDKKLCSVASKVRGGVYILFLILFLSSCQGIFERLEEGGSEEASESFAVDSREPGIYLSLTDASGNKLFSENSASSSRAACPVISVTGDSAWSFWGSLSRK